MDSGDQVNAITAIQDHINDTDDMNLNLQDAQDILSRMDPTTQTEVINFMDNSFRRNELNSFLNRIKEDLDGVKNAIIDQISPSIVEEGFHDVLEMVKPYYRLIGSILDLPDYAVTDQQLNDFIATHKNEYKSMYEDVRSLKLKVKRLVPMEAMRDGQRQPGGDVSSFHSAMKLPRIQIPRFEDNVPGSLSWEKFKQMISKLTNELSDEEKIFVLKSALSGESSKLIANKQNHDLAMGMLSSLYGNELLQSQCSIILFNFVEVILEISLFYFLKFCGFL